MPKEKERIFKAKTQKKITKRNSGKKKKNGKTVKKNGKRPGNNAAAGPQDKYQIPPQDENGDEYSIEKIRSTEKDFTIAIIWKNQGKKINMKIQIDPIINLYDGTYINARENAETCDELTKECPEGNIYVGMPLPQALWFNIHPEPKEKEEAPKIINIEVS